MEVIRKKKERIKEKKKKKKRRTKTWEKIHEKYPTAGKKSPETSEQSEQKQSKT